jgi:hypothetical protein
MWYRMIWYRIWWSCIWWSCICICIWSCIWWSCDTVWWGTVHTPHGDHDTPWWPWYDTVWCNHSAPKEACIHVGLARIKYLYTSCMTVHLVISLPIIPCMHRIYMVLANPTHIHTQTWFCTSNHIAFVKLLRCAQRITTQAIARVPASSCAAWKQWITHSTLMSCH